MDKLLKLNIAWMILLMLTLGGGVMGTHAQPGAWVTLIIAFITLIKGHLVIKHFMELDNASSIIRRVVYGFCAIIPVMMVVTYLSSEQLVWFSHWILSQ